MPKIAVVGNIASGKSVVTDYLASMGYRVYDADIIAHEILETSEEVYSAFKNYDVFEQGVISRKKLGALVFFNQDLKKQLENIIHPLVRLRRENLQSEDLIFVAIPLLFEAKMEDIFDKIIFISASEDIRLQRLMARNSYTKEEAMARIKSQAPEVDKIQQSDYLIENNSDLENLRLQINNILEKITFPC